MSARRKALLFHNITSFLRGQASKMLTSISEEDDVVLVLKNGKPIVLAMSYERYERLLDSGVDILEY
ncbi:type II toxin-antitoxin system Phd/YefM family antitoxin [Corynebacterium diphtheriae]|uniref:Type II toxin-antitoxin system Phd/YefM family antitoxin n=1 Tax=Corynebacterium diphtheriae TaxID=1717 RepID=A0A811G083_CORDP|nr:type II toxin-antitoxin system Phd/YefM family antitoxin [Corynebacterium diphtheriae]MBG9300019.1 type II toxin-antitoxin system Phd/YefM family antitoxin [Corynebacterium diphtheriae bv. mitis]OJI01485.1 prevent-host-death protein [Corynebacterium diphtheriae]OSQ08547.1 prevent-host-death protein [Corynebacterium diphtheriae]OWM96837.1 prevent-host-death protein [Corynebacterium diphtheriae bv. mitis]RKW85903.1 type II toxin-antitoxin system Phd/YefM family antitoxin [Corynebacterium diph